MREAKRMDVEDAEGGATTELLSANVAKVGQLLIDSGLPQLLNGEEFSVEDKRVTDVATLLTFADVLRELVAALRANDPESFRGFLYEGVQELGVTEVEELLLDWLYSFLTAEEQGRLLGWHLGVSV